MNDISIVENKMVKGLKSLLKKVFSESKKEEGVVKETSSEFNDDNECYGGVDPTTLRVFDGVSYDEDGNEYDVSDIERYYEECRWKFYNAKSKREDQIDEKTDEMKSGETEEEQPRKTHHLKLFFESLDEDVEMFENKDLYVTKEYLGLEDGCLEPELFQFLVRDMVRTDYYRRLRDADYANVKLEMMEREEAEVLEKLGILRTKRSDV